MTHLRAQLWDLLKSDNMNVAKCWVEAVISNNDIFRMIQDEDHEPIDYFNKIIDVACICDIEPKRWLNLASTDDWGINYPTHDKLAKSWKEIINKTTSTDFRDNN